ncbi:MAG: hypothetical protein NTW21_16930 [Verrucomicrobia bacterium]|nr:hypothetical protein [Verrucomicrobiota bacterium]
MLNPILFTERVVQDFLRYQLTAYPFADKGLYAQMRQLLNLEETRRSPLLKGPYVSLSRTFEEGIAVADAVKEGWLHPHLTQLISHPHLSRLRALVHERLQEGYVSLGDLVAWLDDRLDKDDSLSNALAPEVWRAHRKAGATAEHHKARKFFLRAQVLRELTIGMRQRIGLEPWGRLSVTYTPLRATDAFFSKWSDRIEMPVDELLRGVELLLDRERRNSHLLLDRENHIFTRYWREGMREIQRGFLPLLPDVPVGLVLRRTPTHNENRIRQWLGKGNSIIRQAADKWRVPESLRTEFVEELWQYLTKDACVLVDVRLLNSKNEALPNCADAHQIDGDVLRISASEKRGVYRCKTCRQTANRQPPRMKCLAFNCTFPTARHDRRHGAETPRRRQSLQVGSDLRTASAERPHAPGESGSAGQNFPGQSRLPGLFGQRTESIAVCLTGGAEQLHGKPTGALWHESRNGAWVLRGRRGARPEVPGPVRQKDRLQCG